MIKKKILVIVPFLKGTGGTETVLKNTQSAYEKSEKKNKYNIKLLSLGGTISNSWYKNWDRRVYSFTKLRFIQDLAYLFFVPFVLLKQLKKENPDIVISTNPLFWTYCYILKKITRKKYKVIAWYHYSISQKPINKLVLKSFDSFFAISTGIKQELLKAGVSFGKIKVLFNPIDLVPASSIIPASHHQVEFLYIGRIDFRGQKNVQELFKALKDVQGNWRLRLFGTCSKIDQKKLTNLAERFNYSDKIFFEGFHKDVWNNISSANILVLTSKFEGFPMILCEAISRGVFVVSSNCATGPEDIINDSNGKIYKKGDVTGLSNILNSIVQKRIEIPRQGVIRSTVNPFSFEKFISNLEEYCNI